VNRYRKERRQLDKWRNEIMSLTKRNPVTRQAALADIYARQVALQQAEQQARRERLANRRRIPRQKRGETWKAWYLRYLRSPHWLDLRALALREAGHRCQHCGRTQMLEVHHKTYKRLRQELLTDLEVLCAPCHDYAHGKDTDDPISREFRAMFGPIG
jgi:5-methylcytosine-specific restriction endonuclease McrA